jgi:ribosomal protein S26
VTEGKRGLNVPKKKAIRRFYVFKSILQTNSITETKRASGYMLTRLNFRLCLDCLGFKNTGFF